jgi:threonine-phosphate decarboxylase
VDQSHRSSVGHGVASAGEGMTQPTHGGNVYKVAHERQILVDQIVDFSANINPLGPPAVVRRAIRSALKQIVHYPDPDCRQLRQALAQQCGVDPDMILVGNGSTELIYLVPRVLAIKSALIIGPTFEEYARALMDAGGTVQYVHARREDRFRPPVKEILRELSATRTRIDAVFLCNPNNPTGQVLNKSVMCKLADAMERRQGWLIVDEAFIDYCQKQSVVSMLRAYPRMVVLRSLTKFYAMPGLRIGYLLGASKVVDQLKERQPPWSVNSLAQEVSCAILRDHAYAIKSCVFMEKERPRFINGLRSLPGIRVYSSVANFVLIELPDWSSAGLVADRLAADGLLVRDCSTLPGLSARMIRVAVRTVKENRRLMTALGVCLKK